MCCNSLDEQTILLSLFGNRALYLIPQYMRMQMRLYHVRHPGPTEMLAQLQLMQCAQTALSCKNVATYIRIWASQVMCVRSTNCI